MKNGYYEHYRISNRPNHLAAELARHLLARQYLGTAVVVCDRPVGLLSQTRKYWLRMARILQKERASTLNAEKILRLTYAISHMQHMKFASKPASTIPNGRVYFVTPSDCQDIPPACLTLYIAVEVPQQAVLASLPKMRQDYTVVDYTPAFSAETLGLQPKQALLDRVQQLNTAAGTLLRAHGLEPSALSAQTQTLDTAFEALQDIRHGFLQQAETLQYYDELARPADWPLEVQQTFDAVTALAYRLQAMGNEHAPPSRYLREDTTRFLHYEGAEEGYELARAFKQLREPIRQKKWQLAVATAVT